MTETDLVRAIIARLNLLHDVHVWRQNVGAFTLQHRGKKRFVRFSQSGAADISGLLAPHGRRLEIEVKRNEKLKPTTSQLAYGEMIRSMGGIWFWTWSIDDCLRKLRNCK